MTLDHWNKIFTTIETEQDVVGRTAFSMSGSDYWKRLISVQNKMSDIGYSGHTSFNLAKAMQTLNALCAEYRKENCI